MSAAKKPKRLSLREISTAIGRTPRAIQEYVQRGMPRYDDGKYDYDTVVEWIAKNISNRGMSVVLGSVGETDEIKNRQFWEAKKIEEQARREGLKRLEMEGELIQRSEVKRDTASVAVRLRTRLLALGGQLAALTPAEMKAVIKQKVEATVMIALKEALEAPLAQSTIEQMILDEADRIRAERAS